MPVSLPTQIEQILNLDPAAVNAHCRGLYDACAGPLGEQIVLFGAGFLGQVTLARLRSLGIEPLAFADNDPRKWGAKVDGLQVISRAEAVRRWGDRATFVVTIYEGSKVREQLRGEGCKATVPASYLCWKHPETFLPFGGITWAEETLNHGSEISQAAELWADDRSREVFLSQLRFRMSLDCTNLPEPSPARETYFPPEIALRPDEVFVDCGAFDGDSIEAFMAQVPEGRAVGVEADPSNFIALNNRIERQGWHDQVSAHNVAASSQSGFLRFEAIGSAGSTVNGSGALTLPCVRLDDLLPAQAATFIKMDIEGSELDALKGSAETIRAHRPILAICLYHKPEDLWEIPLFVHSLGCGYKLMLRAYAEECWELVMYAVPQERLTEGRS